jgi:peptidoglycan/LPS O-acetylase OafA/YrhL
VLDRNSYERHGETQVASAHNVVREKQLDALTGVRFLAAFAVFNVHYLLPERWGYEVPMSVQSSIGSGTAGVSLFFMLSGFVLAYANENWLPSRIGTLKFWSSRAARIYPAYFLALLWFAPFILLHRFSIEPPDVAIRKALASFIPTALLVQSWFYPRFAISWNGPGWTLSVETVFYLLFPLIAPRVRSLPNWQKLSLCLACWILSAVLSLLDPFLVSPSALRDEFVLFNPIFHLPTFVSGVALGYHFTQRTQPLSGTALSIVGLFLVSAISSVAYLMPHPFVQNALFLPAFGLLLYGLALGGWPASWLSRPRMVVLGEASYSLYILQFSIVFSLMWAEQRFAFHDFIQVGRTHPVLSGLQFYVLSAMVSIAVAILVQRFYERPLRSYIRGRLFGLIDNSKKSEPGTEALNDAGANAG